MRHITLMEAIMIRVSSLGKKQHYVQMGNFKTAYEELQGNR